MKRRMMCLFAIGVMLLSLSGCSVAKNVETAHQEECLVGAAVTFESLTDMGMDGAEAVTALDEDGRTTYAFDGLNGFVLYAIPEKGVVASSVDDVFLTKGFHVGMKANGASVEGEDWEIEAELWAAPREDLVCYLNPIYQRTDGSVYVTSSAGYAASLGELDVLLRADKTTVVMVDGQNTTHSCSVTVRVVTRQEASRFVLVQMDGENGILTQDTWLPGQLPEELVLEEDCAWLLLEAHGEEVERTLVNRGEEELLTWQLGEGGIFIPHTVKLIWQ